MSSNAQKFNLALNKPAYQSSDYYFWQCGYLKASKAVDGNRNPDTYSCSCSHVADVYGDPTWLSVDLLAKYLLDFVIVYNRQGDRTRKLFFRNKSFWYIFCALLQLWLLNYVECYLIPILFSNMFISIWTAELLLGRTDKCWCKGQTPTERSVPPLRSVPTKDVFRWIGHGQVQLQLTSWKVPHHTNGSQCWW